MERRALFIAALDDLHEKLAPEQSEYNVLRTSGLLRQLLIDKPCLVDQVQADWEGRHGSKVDVWFRIAIGGPYEERVLSMKPVLWAVNDGFYPPGRQGGSRCEPGGLPWYTDSRV